MLAIPFLVQADQMQRDAPHIVDSMYAGAPDLHQWVTAWTVHPYGPPWNSSFRSVNSYGYLAWNALQIDGDLRRPGIPAAATALKEA